MRSIVMYALKKFSTIRITSNTETSQAFEFEHIQKARLYEHLIDNT